jgi:hypothetical protein
MRQKSSKELPPKYDYYQGIKVMTGVNFEEPEDTNELKNKMEQMEMDMHNIKKEVFKIGQLEKDMQTLKNEMVNFEIKMEEKVESVKTLVNEKFQTLIEII